MEVDQLLNNYQEFINQIEGVIFECKDTSFDQKVCEDALDRFYTEGWDLNYSDDVEGNFYLGGDRRKT